MGCLGSVHIDFFPHEFLVGPLPEFTASGDWILRRVTGHKMEAGQVVGGGQWAGVKIKEQDRLLSL